MLITSKQNQTVKRTALLKQKKYRKEFGEYIIEGEKMLKEALALNQDVLRVFVTEDYDLFFLNEFDFDFDKVYFVNRAVLDYLTDEVTPQGVLSVVRIPESAPISSLSCVLLLDRLQDPGNVGAVLRLSAACGVKDVITVDCADAYSTKAVRSSMSGIFRCNVLNLSNEQAYELLKQNDLPLVTADMNGKNLFSFTSPERFCLVLGNEGNGVSDFFKNNAHYTISIPMKNNVESLNVATAAGITLYSLLKNTF